MESLFLLVPIALVFVAIAIKILFWAIKSGQYDNLDTEAHRILFDEEPTEKRRDTTAPDQYTKTPDTQPPETSEKSRHD